MSDSSTKKSKSGCIIAAIVIGVGGIVILSILAAIAIPAFTRYINASKAAEASMTVMQTGNAISMYYTKNCKFPSDGPKTMTAMPTGQKSVASYTGGWKEIEMTTADGQPQYFQYAFKKMNDGVRVTAELDFQQGGPAHTVEMMVTADPSQKCSVVKGRKKTINEFE